MPVYTFRCRKCKQDNIEAEHRFDEPHPTRHKGYGGKIERSFRAPEVVYKGSGFYTTDRRLDTPAENFD